MAPKYDIKLQMAFDAHRKERPEIYGLLVALARQAKAANFKRYSINALFEVLRHNWNIKKGPEEEFKMNNNFRSRYARLIMANEPDLKDFFEIRELHSMTSAEIASLGLNETPLLDTLAEPPVSQAA